MADYEEAPVSAFRRVFGDVNVVGCWFHYAQAVIKRVQKLGLRDDYMNDANVQDTVRCLLGLPLLPAGSICEAFEDVTLAVVADNVWGSKVKDLLRYVRRQWLQKRSIGPERSRTNNILSSFILTFQCFFLIESLGGSWLVILVYYYYFCVLVCH